MEEGRWSKILVFSVVVLFVKAGIWRSKEVYDYYVVGHRYSALFVFGDSLADAGNNNFINTSVVARANFYPYGKSYFAAPTGRFSDGRTIFDFLATSMGVPFPAPWFQPGIDFDFSQGANFASAGSGILDSSAKHLNVISFGNQVKEFRNIFHKLEGESGYPVDKFLAEAIVAEAIVAINIGANDILYKYMDNTSVEDNNFMETLLTAYKSHLLNLHDMGARKFVVFGISALGCSPSMRFCSLSRSHGECDENLNKLIQQFNAGLEKLILSLNTVLKESTILYVNTYDLLVNIIHNRKTLGFSESDYACYGEGPYKAAVRCGQTNFNYKKVEGSVCKDPTKYVFWDGLHPTEKVQHMIAEEVWRGKCSSVYPFNLNTLIHSTPPPNIPLFTA